MHFNKKVPQAKKIETKLVKHNHLRIDNYFWLNNPENPEVIDYLEAENEYAEHYFKPSKNFQKKLFEELKARIKENDESVPYKYNGYWYMVKFDKGKDYPIYIRKKKSLNNKEEIIVDCNELAKEHDYFKLVGLNISPDNNKVAYGVDIVSRRKYTIYIKNLENNTIYPECIENTTGNSTWANDNKTLFFSRKDKKTLRSNRIFKHKLNTNTKSDSIVFNEKDETYYTYIFKSKSEKYLIIGSSSTLSDEYRILDANKPDEDFKIFTPREKALEHHIYHYKNDFYIITNADHAVNFKLMKTHENKTHKKHWLDVIPNRKDVLLKDIDIFKDYLVISERNNGLDNIIIKPWNQTLKSYSLHFNSETYTASTTTNIEFNTNILRYNYSSLTTPNSIIDFNMEDKSKTVKKVNEIPDGKFNSNNYKSERIKATAQDGKKIPLSLVYKKGIKKDGKNPVLLYAYGSYGYTVSPSFKRNYFSLIDRGFIFAIAHVRGSDYLGRDWYDEGKLFDKKNTFTDFIDCSKHLIEQNYTSPKHLYASGGSAGGLLIGAIINIAPKLYHGVIAAVPFVDVVTTMLDDSIPLTTFEYDEWGNPNQKKDYQYMLSYSPYDQIKTQNYPHILVTTGLHDSQVQYWEPAKWVAKLRELKTDTNMLLLKTNMKTGHGGASGRFESLKEVAQEFTFLLHLEHINE